MTHSVGSARKISVVSLEMPWLAYNVRSGVNNTFRFTVTGGSYTATVTEGSYSMTALATALGTALTATGGIAATVAYSSTTLKMTITASDSTFAVVSTTLSTMLGFTSGQTGGTVVGTNAARNYLDDYFYVYLPQLGGDVLSTYPCTFRIPVPVDSGNVLYADYSSAVSPPTLELDVPTSFSRLQVKLVDQLGNTLALNGANWSMLLQIDCDF
jgi:hypothetical protein